MEKKFQQFALLSFSFSFCFASTVHETYYIIIMDACIIQLKLEELTHYVKSNINNVNI